MFSGTGERDDSGSGVGSFGAMLEAVWSLSFEVVVEKLGESVV
jgi:hypothetical protein